MPKTLFKILKKALLMIGIVLVIILNFYISSELWFATSSIPPTHWFSRLTQQLTLLIVPPLHHFEWNTLKPDSPFVWYIWNMIKLIISNIPYYGVLYLLGNTIAYSARKTLPTATNLLMLPLNYFKVTIFTYLLTEIIIFPINLLVSFEILKKECLISLGGVMFSHVFWLSIFFAWRQISHRDKPSKFHLPAFPKASPSPTL